jgi:hypothetical protein
MKRNSFIFLLGFVAGALAAYIALALAGYRIPFSGRREPQPSPTCYSCLWEGYDAKVRQSVIDFYRQYYTQDPMVAGDVHYILWRASGNPNCDARDSYRQVARGDANSYRRYLAETTLGFSGPECGQDSTRNWKAAAQLAQQLGFSTEAGVLRDLSRGRFTPRFGDTEIATVMEVRPGATTLVLGESVIELTPGMRVGAQVDRVARDWISVQMKWDLSGRPLPAAAVIDYHEGSFVKTILEQVSVEVYPLAGSIVAEKEGSWSAPDETGTFRFQVLGDKLQYPTSHATDSVGWIVDTHGLSVLVPQALEQHVALVVGCGDAEGKAKAAFHLAQHGVNVVMPGDRFQDLLLGYKAKGILLGTAPVKTVNAKTVIGGQPIRFSLTEPIVVQDTKQIAPVQYYDSPARYFRRLRQFVRLRLDFVDVDDVDQIQRLLDRAAQLRSSVVAVRVVTAKEYNALRHWLEQSPKNRAIVFHSALYPFAHPPL